MKLWLLIIIALLLAALALALCSRIHFALKIKKRGSDERLEFTVTALYGLVKYHYTVPHFIFEGIRCGLNIKLEKNGISPSVSAQDKERNIDRKDVSEWMEFGQRALAATRGLKPWTSDTLAHVKITRLHWSTDFSLGDAAGTATAAGALWALKWWLIGRISQSIRLKDKPRLFVVPRFVDQICYMTDVDCAGELSAGYAVYAGFRLALRVIREDEGVRQWRELLKIARRGNWSKELKGQH
ncbi:DUF2953 domain-containing protein [Paenibacillus sp. HN-1]|uniref:DUF2953 domain-containing protein n=1 Tax=Paenibacillus TaxID=44249 RepID=UPI001CA9D3AF|nr:MULTISPECIES: DUF2953 domain-containing protein [Paenibacillus]MBY9081601.1 DUF2953 domain-containing protein [Paenibacillus sp. CGMCC 1.18879]MBY9083470.1 DUF2953 domain-containing protein [Paenibacillus sinensis]